jgi:broad specificity phosphatase PhoE
MHPSPPSPSNPTHIKTLYLIRHGETDANAKGIMQGRGINPPLSIKGRRQALELGKRFKETPEIELIVVSSLQVWGSWLFPFMFI